MLIGLVLLVAALLAPALPRAMAELTGLGAVVWRFTWPAPVAAAVGAAAVGLGRSARVPAPLRAAPAVLVCLALGLTGTPMWSPSVGSTLARKPVLKRLPEDIAAARVALAAARPGDVILAPQPVSQTVVVLSGDVTVVRPRFFFNRPLDDEPSFHGAARGRLERWATSASPSRRERDLLRRDLRRVGVDVACVPPAARAARRELREAGFVPAASGAGVACLRSSGS
jgi:hypothetical protein